MPTEKVVAKVSVLGGKPAADSFANMAYSADDLAAALTKAAAAAERLGVLLPALTKDAKDSATSMALVAKATNTAAGGTTAEVAAADAATVATQKRTIATADSAKAAEAAAISHNKLTTALGGLATNNAIKSIAKYGLGAGALTLYEGIKKYTSVTTAMTQLVTQAGLSPKSLPFITKGALDISTSTGVALSDVANQLYRIQSANVGLNLTNKQLLTMGKNAANLAVLFNTAPGSQTEQLARMFGALTVAGAQNKLQDVGSPKNIMALLNATIGAGDIRGTDLVGGLGRGVLQSAQAVHAKLPDVLTWMALATKFAANASTSGTLISHSLQQIATPSAQGAKAEAMVGVAPGQLRNIIQNQGISQAINFLMKSIGKGFNPNPAYPASGGQAPGAASALAQFTAWGAKMNPQDAQAFLSGTMNQNQIADMQQFMLTKIFGGARQEIPVLTVAENQKLFGTLEADIKKHATQAVVQRDLAIAMNTPGRQLDIARANLAKVAYDVGKIATPLFVSAMRDLGDVGKWFSKHPTALKDTLLGLTAFIGSATALYVGGKLVAVAKDLAMVGKGLWALASAPFKALMKLFGLGGAPVPTEVAPTTEFAGSVTEFAAAVEKFAITNGNPFSKPTSVVKTAGAGAAAAETPTAVGFVANATNFAKSGAGVATGLMAVPALGESLNWLVTHSNPQYGTPWKTAQGGYINQAPGSAVNDIMTNKKMTPGQQYTALQALLQAGHGTTGFAGLDTEKNPHSQAWWDNRVKNLLNSLGPAGVIGAHVNQQIANSYKTASEQIHKVSKSHQSAAAKQFEKVTSLNKDVVNLRKQATLQEQTAWADGAKGQTAAAKAHEAAAKKLSEAADKLNSVTIQISASQIATAVNTANGNKIARTLGSYGPAAVFAGG